MKRMQLAMAFALGISISAPGFGHHSVGANFDQSQLVEVEGVITEVLWRNPHVLMKMTGTDADGVEREWRIEGNSVSNVRRQGLSKDMMLPGTVVRIAGNPGRVETHTMWLMNMLLPDSTELLFTNQSKPRWSGDVIGEVIQSDVAADPDGELGIFRVWTNATPPPFFWGGDHPLTESAQAVKAAFDPVKDAVTLNCAPKGMPFILEQPYPMEFIDEGDVIVMRLEEFDTVRRINMTPDSNAQGSNPEILGFSSGRWEGDTLVVETTGVNYSWFDPNGTPQGPEIHVVERYQLNEDGSRLELEVTHSDPQTFTETITLNKAWEWRPGEEVQAFDCVPDE